MLDKSKLKMRDRNVYFRERMEGVYERDKPGLQVRKATDKFLTKKQQMLEAQQTDPNLEESMLNDLISEIREILTKKEV